MNETKLGFNAKVYESGSSLVLTVPRNVVKVNDITAGDILSLELQKVTEDEPDSQN